MIKNISLGQGFRPFPSYSDRNAWQALPERVRSHYLGEAAKLKGFKWPTLPASLYLEFYRNGNRSNYEKLYFDRRAALLNLVIAECIEGSGEYLDDIINGVWHICEETTWVVPAHLNRRLNDPEDDIYIDLFAAETASLLAWVYYFLGDAIAAEATEVKRRMEEEVFRRVLLPFLEKDHFPWMGLDHDNPVNNWNPWINSNVLAAYLVFAPVFPRAEDGVNKAIRSINRFIHFYTEDGGCDEGPSYFSVAGASLLDFIEALAHVSDVSYLYREPKIQNMVAYIYKVYIGKGYYVNYADAPPRVFVAASTLYRAGKNTGNPTLSAFVSYLRANKWVVDDSVSRSCFCVYRRLAAMFAGPVPDGPVPEEAGLEIPTLAWFPGIQVVTARDNGDSAKGFFFSAKGGTNAESHNHNDVGNFILYCDGTPVLVDAGVETYTKFTFSDARYSLWTMQSCYHNTPTLNGVDQAPGAEYRARDIALSGVNGGLASGEAASCPASGIRFSLDISGAYPASAGVKAYKREFVFCPGKYLEVTDTWSFNECTSPLAFNLLCHERPVITGGKAELSGLVCMEFGPFVPEVEEIKLTDPKIHHDWQKDSLYRLRLVGKGKEQSGSVVLRFTRK